MSELEQDRKSNRKRIHKDIKKTKMCVSATSAKNSTKGNGNLRLVSAEKTSEESILIENVIELTGLPKHVVKKELEDILKQNGHELKDQITLEELRAAMINYLMKFHESFEESDSGCEEALDKAESSYLLPTH